MKKFILFTALISVMLSCQKDNISLSPKSDSEDGYELINLNGRLVKARKLTNPYGISNMREAYAKLVGDATKSEGDTLSPNCYYVKVFITSPLLSEYFDSLEVELFNAPLDYEILEDEVDPDIVEEDGPHSLRPGDSVNGDDFEDTDDDPDGDEETIGEWFYTVVKNFSVIPQNCPYILLEECYVPDDDDDDLVEEDDDEEDDGNSGGIHQLSLKNTNGSLFAELLEKEAILNANLPDGYGLSEETKASGKSPSGYIKVHDNETETDIPVKGVKMRCNYFVKIAHTHTDANGYYSFVGKKKWSCNPYYHTIYRNTKDFSLWGRYAYLSPTSINYGRHSKSGYSHTFNTSETGWRYSVINNAAYDYYSMCTSTGIALPPSNLRIWNMSVNGKSSAVMLHRISKSIAKDLYSGNIFDSVSGEVLNLISRCMPDLTIASKKPYYLQYSVTWHELCHASHYSVIGNLKWESYIKHTLSSWASNHGVYGDKKTCNDYSIGGAGICGISESWAYAYETVIGKSFNSYYSNGDDEWFSHNKTLIEDLILNNILTPSQIFYVMTSLVSTKNLYIDL